MGLNLGVFSKPQSRAILTRRSDTLQSKTEYNSDSTPFQLVRLYNAGSALTANRPYMVTFAGSSTTVQNPQVTALAAAAGVQQHIVIAHEAVGATSWGWFCFQGYHSCGVEGTTDVAAGDFLRVVAATSTAGLVKDGTSRTQQSCAIACAAQAANSVVDTRVYLFGGPALTSLAQTAASLGLDDGTITVPSLFFSADTDVGIFRNAANSMSFVTGGDFRLRVRDNGLELNDGGDITLGETTGTKIGTATTNKLGFFNATPIVQLAGTTDLRQGLINLGFLATGGASPLNLNGGLLTFGTAQANGDVTMAGGSDFALATASGGTKLGTGATQLLGFWGATAVDQPAAYTQTFATADRTHAARTATTLTVADGAGTNDGTIGAITADASVIAAVQELAAAVNALIVDLADTAQLVNALVDDHQETGLCA